MASFNSLHRRRSPTCLRGFTLVELIAVMVIVGVLGSIGVARFFERSAFDARAFTDQTKALLRYAQKVAIAQQGRPVYVRLNGSSVALCFADQNCTADNLVLPPAGINSRSASTRTNCGVDAWACEGVPQGLAYTLTPATATAFYFDPQGKPFAVGDAWLAQDSTFSNLVINITGDGVDHQVTVEQETGNVY